MRKRERKFGGYATLELQQEASRRYRARHRERLRPKWREKMKGKPRYTSRESKVEWEKRNPEKIHAHRVLNGYVRRGQVLRPTTCEECGKDPGLNKAGRSLIHGHHEDYSKPMEVLWLCVDCHRRRDRLEVSLALPAA